MHHAGCACLPYCLIATCSGLHYASKAYQGLTACGLFCRAQSNTQASESSQASSSESSADLQQWKARTKKSSARNKRLAGPVAATLQPIDLTWGAPEMQEAVQEREGPTQLYEDQAGSQRRPPTRHPSRSSSRGAPPVYVFSHEPSQLRSMKLSELRPICKDYGLTDAGLKPQIVQRILQFERKKGRR